MTDRHGRLLFLLGLCALVVLVPTAIAVQPAYDLRDDLVSDLGARGSRWPWLGHAVVLSVALAHVGAAVVVRAWELAAAAWVAAVVVAVALVGVVAFPITCPRGARGCNGPDSGRAFPRPLADVVHRDLVVVVEAGSLVLVALVLVHLARRRAQVAVSVVTVALVASPVCLLVQQQGEDIGYWQLSWLVALLTPLAVLTTVRAPRPASVQAR